MYVRISKGSYAPELHAQVNRRLNESSQSLVPAIRKLPGRISYYVGADETTKLMVNVSVWDSLEHALAMGTLSEMAALAKEFIAMDVQFERPIANYPVMWKLPSD